MSQIRLWQWANVLALDAMFIALLWQSLFAEILEIRISVASRAVLGISIWLVYTADRLFDVVQCPFEQLNSTRHLFAKRNGRILWTFWIWMLTINLLTAFMCLKIHQLQNGMALLALCLLYTGLNQKLSSRFFPKEFCVAVIYTGGVIVFLLPATGIWIPSAFLMLLCLINCLVISFNEWHIDAAMKAHSMVQFLPRLPFLLYTCCILMLGTLEQQWQLPFAISLTALIIVHVFQKQLPIESFRVLADGALLTGPLLTLLYQHNQ